MGRLHIVQVGGEYTRLSSIDYQYAVRHVPYYTVKRNFLYHASSRLACPVGPCDVSVGY